MVSPFPTIRVPLLEMTTFSKMSLVVVVGAAMVLTLPSFKLSVCCITARDCILLDLPVLSSKWMVESD